MTRSLRAILSGVMLTLAGSASWADPVDINRADAAAIASNLKGIGAHKAEAIVAYRNAHGPFKSADELTAVQGIGQRTVDLNRHDIQIETPKK